MKFAEKLKELRGTAGISQAGLASQSGMSLSAIHDYEQGKREPSLRSAVKLARALGADCRAFAECEDMVADKHASSSSPPRRGRPAKPAEAPSKKPRRKKE